MFTPIEQLYQYYLNCSSISTDSRTIQKGNLFFALKGPNFDGNTKATEALGKGAKYAVVDDLSLKGKNGMLLVEDVLETLQRLATHHRRTFDFPVFAITGSNGKTTTKELMFSVLVTKFRVWCTPGNLNNHIGVPVTILRTPPNTNFLIVEMGANQPGDIRELCEIAEPNFGLITNIGMSHLEGLHDMNGVYQEKSQLFEYIETKGERLFRNIDDPLLNESNYWSKVSDYGTQLVGSHRVTLNLGESQFLQFSVIDGPKIIPVNTNLIGDYNLQNCVAAIAVADYFNVKLEDVAMGVQSYEPDNMRSQLIEKKDVTIVLDAYNANPTSMIASIKSFVAKYGINESLIVVGDMLEMGEKSLAYHQKIVDLLVTTDVKYISIGEEFNRTKQEPGMSFSLLEEAEATISKAIGECKILLIKGSRGMKLERIVDLV